MYQRNSRMNRLLFSIALLLAVPALSQQRPAQGTQQQTYQPPTFSDPDRLKKIETLFPAIDRIYRDYAAKNHFPGLTYGVVVDGKLVFSGGVGYTDVAKKIPATPASVFRIASMSKSITALAILKLRDENKPTASPLRLDNPVATYLPEAKNVPYLTADAPTLTIRHLMTHSAGFPEDNPWGDRQLADSDADLLTLLRNKPSVANVPGITYEYSNLGFAMLGRIVTQVSGQPYQRYISEQLLKPLGMTHTEWEYDRVPAAQLALGYRWLDSNWADEPLLHDGSYGAMGGLLTSIDDFSRYIAVQQAAWPPRNESDASPVRRSSLREMQLPHTFSGFNPKFKFPGGRSSVLVSHYAYGLGWTRDAEGRVYVGHSGGLPGFGSQWRMMPDYGIAVVAFANLTYANLGTANWAVLDTLLTGAGLQPRQLPVSPILAQRKAELVALLPNWANAETSGIFAENFFPDQSLAARQQLAQALFAQAGRIIRVGELQPENQLRGHFILVGDRATIDVFFTLTPENPALIQQLDLVLLN